MYRQWSPYVRPVVTICTTSQWSLYVPPVVTICAANGHYMYRQWSLYLPSVVIIFTASSHYMCRQWSLYVPSVVIICTASSHYMCRQWSLYVPSGLPFKKSMFCPHSVFMCSVWISEHAATISLYSINWLVCITETECVYCAVRTGSLNPFILSLFFFTRSLYCTKWHCDRLFSDYFRFPLSVSLDQLCTILVSIHILPLPDEPFVGIRAALGRQVLSLLVKCALSSGMYVTLFSIAHHKICLTAPPHLVFLFISVFGLL
jgi:hypothetical protein